MKIDKTCKTCEYNFISNGKNICASVNYGEEIKDFEKERDCWSIGLEYYIELIENLNEKNRYIFECLTNDFILKKDRKKLYEELEANNETEVLLKMIERQE